MTTTKAPRPFSIPAAQREDGTHSIEAAFVRWSKIEDGFYVATLPGVRLIARTPNESATFKGPSVYDEQDLDVVAASERALARFRADYGIEAPKTTCVASLARQDVATIKAVSKVSGSELSRFAFCSVKIDKASDGVYAVATDGIRLHWSKLEASTAEKSLLLPRASFSSVTEGNVYADKKHLHVGGWFGEEEKGKFPEWRAVKPSSFKYSCTLDRAALVAALKALKKTATDECRRSVKFAFQGANLNLSGKAFDGECEGSFALKARRCTAKVVLGLNPRFVLDSVAFVSKTADVQMEFSEDPNRPCFFTSEDFPNRWALLMPTTVPGW